MDGGRRKSPPHVLEFIAEQRRPRGDGRVVRLPSASGLYVDLTMCDEGRGHPRSRGLATRRPKGPGEALIRTLQTVPMIVEPAEVHALMAALRRCRDRADGLDEIIATPGPGPAWPTPAATSCVTRA